MRLKIVLIAASLTFGLIGYTAVTADPAAEELTSKQNDDSIHYGPPQPIIIAILKEKERVTRECMFGMAQVALSQRMPTRSGIVAYIVKQCGWDIAAIIRERVGRPEKEINTYLDGLANDELNNAITEGR